MKTCDKCEFCPVLKIDERLRKTYDLVSGTEQFEDCGERMKGNDNPNIICFTKYFARTIDWKKLEKVYKENSAAIDKEIENGRAACQQDE